MSFLDDVRLSSVGLDAGGNDPPTMLNVDNIARVICRWCAVKNGYQDAMSGPRMYDQILHARKNSEKWING
jgi:hypothetical protein